MNSGTASMSFSGNLGNLYFSSTPPVNHKPKRIVSIDNQTIKCVFEDKKEVFVTVKEPDIFDENVGVSLAVCTHLFGSKTKFFEYVAEIIERPVRTEKKIEKKKKAKKA